MGPRMCPAASLLDNTIAESQAAKATWVLQDTGAHTQLPAPMLTWQGQRAQPVDHQL